MERTYKPRKTVTNGKANYTLAIPPEVVNQIEDFEYYRFKVEAVEDGIKFTAVEFLEPREAVPVVPDNYDDDELIVSVSGSPV